MPNMGNILFHTRMQEKLVVLTDWFAARTTFCFCVCNISYFGAMADNGMVECVFY